MFRMKSDRRRIPVSVILYRIILLLTALVAAVQSYRNDEIPLRDSSAKQTLGQALMVPADPFSGISPLTSSEKLPRPSTASECIHCLFDLWDDSLGHASPDGGGL